MAGLQNPPLSEAENVRRLLETRRMQVVTIDLRLTSQVAKAIRELTGPEDAIVWARSIAEIALDLIWAKELATPMTLPADWLRQLQHAGERPPDDGKIPPKRGAQWKDRDRRQSMCGLRPCLPGQP